MKLISTFVFSLITSFLLMPSLKASNNIEEFLTEVRTVLTPPVPNKILMHILNYLEPEELMICERVSRRFLKVAQQIWQDKYKEITLKNIRNDSIKKFVKDRRPFKGLNVSKIERTIANFPKDIFVDLSKKISLRKLDISGNLLYDNQLESLSTLQNLRTLIMNKVIILDMGDALKPLSRLTNLTHLEVNSNQLAPGALQYLRGLTSLQFLDISHNLALDAESLDYLKSLSCLTYLNFENTRIKKEDIEPVDSFDK